LQGESHQSYNLTRLLESAAFVERFDVVVIADMGTGQITPAAQHNLVKFVEAGGGLVWGLCGKATSPFQDSPAAVPMPLAARVLYRQVRQDHRHAQLAHLCPTAQHGPGRGPLLGPAGRRQAARPRTGQGDVHRERCLEYGRQPVQLSDGAGVHLPAGTADHRQFPVLHGNAERRGTLLLWRPATGREFSANYNDYWAWRNLRGRMLEAKFAGADGQDSLRAISSMSRDGKTITAIVYFGAPVWTKNARFETATVEIDVTLPPGQWTLTRSDVTWKARKESDAGVASGHGRVRLLLAPYQAGTLTWTRK